MRAQHDRSDGDEGAREAIAGHGEKPTQFRGAEGYCSEMATADMELVRRSFGGSLESAAAYWDPDLEYVEDPRLPGASTFKGRDAVVRRFREYMDLLGEEDGMTITVERVLDAGARQVPFVRFRGQASTSGTPFDHLWAYLVEVKGERIVYIRAFYEPGEALAAAGLEPGS